MFDEIWLQSINGDWTNPALDRFMAILSNYNFWLPFIVLGVLWALFMGGPKGRAMVFAAACCLGINDGIYTRLGKNLVNRPRPTEARYDTRSVSLQLKSPLGFGAFAPVQVTVKSQDDELKLWGGRSFPSGHVFNNVMLAVLFAYFLGTWGWLYLIFALGIAYSRIYVGAHWPTDVLLTIAMAMAATFLDLALIRWGWVKLGPRYLKGLFAKYPNLFPPLLELKPG